jgi:TatA/E family protein of Tat protein translocase
MFGMGMPEIILILAIALIVLGPKKLPEIAKSLGRGIAEFKKATQDFKQNIEVDNDFKEAKDTIREIKGDIEQGVRESVSGTAPPESGDLSEKKEPLETNDDASSKEEVSPPPEAHEQDLSSPPPDSSPAGNKTELEEQATKEKGSA